MSAEMKQIERLRMSTDLLRTNKSKKEFKEAYFKYCCDGKSTQAQEKAYQRDMQSLENAGLIDDRKDPRPNGRLITIWDLNSVHKSKVVEIYIMYGLHFFSYDSVSETDKFWEAVFEFKPKKIVTKSSSHSGMMSFSMADMFSGSDSVSYDYSGLDTLIDDLYNHIMSNNLVKKPR